MALVNNSVEALRAWWQTATPATRAAAAGMAALLVLGLIVAVALASSPDYVSVATGLNGKDAAAVEKILHDKNIQYKVDDNGTTISVPSKDRGEALVAINAEGIQDKDAQVPGLQALDSISLGTSSDVEKQKILTSNEAVVESMLEQISAVQSAQVIIAPGNTSSLFGNDIPATASVRLTLKPNETLTSEQSRGIVGLVTHAYPGLTTANVALSDQTGAPLYKDNGAGGNALGDGQPLDASARYAEAQRQKLQDLLDATFGPHKTRLLVNAELDYDQTQVDSVEHTPASGSKTGLPVSVQEKEESYTGGGAPAVGGAAGTGSNLTAPSYPSGSGAGSGGAYKNTDTTTNYENDVRHTVVNKAAGSNIKRLTVAALVDTTVPTAAVPQIQATLATAIGAIPSDTSRSVTVQQVAFDNSAQKDLKAQMQAAQSQQLWGNVARAVAVCVVAAVLLFLLTRSGRRAATPQMALSGAGANIGLLEKDGDALDAMLEERPLRVEDVLAEMPEITTRPTRRRMSAPSIEEQQNLKLESIQDMVDTNPESVALLLKGWMAEEARVS